MAHVVGCGTSQPEWESGSVGEWEKGDPKEREKAIYLDVSLAEHFGRALDIVNAWACAQILRICVDESYGSEQGGEKGKKER